MGCDIHIYTEKKDRDGIWRCADYYEVNQWHDEEDEFEPKFNHVDFYRGRNYELFGALAGVRLNEINHIGPKGFPSDASKECLADFERWGCDAHTPSWLTLGELKQHQKDLGSTIKRQGMISEKQKEELDNGKKPEIWCAWTNQDGYVSAEWEDEGNPLDHFIEELNNFLSMKYWEYQIESMDDSDFRIVFWFDN